MQSSKYLIQAATLVNRSPILTRSPTCFEAALYQYNSNIGRALFNPFPYDFYFKSGSLLKRQFNQEERVRESQAFNWGKKTSLKSSKSKKDTSKSPKITTTTEVKPSISTLTLPLQEDDTELMSRTTEADKINDVKNLNRHGHRNLYLLIKRKSSQWRLPGAQGGLLEGELLHEAAKRELHEECGKNMDVWQVGRHPIGVMNASLSRDNELGHYINSKVFFLKAHILAGQIDSTVADLDDYAWLTRAEIRQTVTQEYWKNICCILSDY